MSDCITTWAPAAQPSKPWRPTDAHRARRPYQDPTRELHLDPEWAHTASGLSAPRSPREDKGRRPLSTGSPTPLSPPAGENPDPQPELTVTRMTDHTAFTSDTPPIEIETGPNPQWSVIWMHGLGADGSDFAPIVPELGLPEGVAVRFVFPHAPFRPVTCNGGYVMRAWYDIVSLAPGARQIDEAGLLESRAFVRQLIEREAARGVPSERIILAGFSQGGAVAYLSALTHPTPLAGVIALSTYIPSARLMTAELAEENRHVPIFAAHGTDDDVVSLELGEQARAMLQALGLAPEWRTYAMPHSVCMAEVADIGAWLRRLLGGAR